MMAKIKDAIQSGQIDAMGANLFGAAVHVLTTDVERTRSYLQTQLSEQGIKINGKIQIEEPSLEDAFIQLVNRADATQLG